MYSRILVPLDGSERAERAVPVAERVARNSGADSHITLLHVVRRPAPLSGAYVPQSPAAQWIQQDVAAAKAYLAHVAGWPLLNGLSVDIKVEIGGAPAAVILDGAEADGANLIVIGSHGRTGPAHWLLGSVAVQVARHASMPVLVLREQEATPISALTAHEQPLRVLVPLDGSALAEAALDSVATLMLALAGLHQAALHLVIVLPPIEADAQIVPEHPALQSVRVYLMRTADRLRAIYPRLEVGWSIVPGVDTAGALLRVIESGGPASSSEAPCGYDLIAMATHGRSGVAHWMLGSITEQMLQHTHLPLLVVSPHAADAQKAVRRAEQTLAPVKPPEQIHATAGAAGTLWTPLF
jgi:nucleotide-binding universal stress UspA family protein